MSTQQDAVPNPHEAAFSLALSQAGDAVEAGVLDIADLALRIRERRGQVRELQTARGRLLSQPDGAPRLQADPATVAAQVEGLRALLAKGTVGQRRAFLRAWVKKIAVHGRELRIVYSFPWIPEGEPVAANEAPGGVVLLAEHASREARTAKAEPSERRVPPLIVSGSPHLRPPGIQPEPTGSQRQPNPREDRVDGRPATQHLPDHGEGP